MITEQGKKAALHIFGPQVGQRIINIANGPRSAARTKATPGPSFMDKITLGGKASSVGKSGMAAFFGERKTPPGAALLLTKEFLEGKVRR